MSTIISCSRVLPQAGKSDPIRPNPGECNQQPQLQAGKLDPSLILLTAIQVNTINSCSLKRP